MSLVDITFNAIHLNSRPRNEFYTAFTHHHRIRLIDRLVSLFAKGSLVEALW